MAFTRAFTTINNLATIYQKLKMWPLIEHEPFLYLLEKEFDIIPVL